jgi:hypothetical protein
VTKNLVSIHHLAEDNCVFCQISPLFLIRK